MGNPGAWAIERKIGLYKHLSLPYSSLPEPPPSLFSFSVQPLGCACSLSLSSPATSTPTSAATSEMDIPSSPRRGFALNGESFGRHFGFNLPLKWENIFLPTERIAMLYLARVCPVLLSSLFHGKKSVSNVGRE